MCLEAWIQYYPGTKGSKCPGLTTPGFCKCSMMCLQDTDSHGCTATLHGQTSGKIDPHYNSCNFFTGFWSHNSIKNTLPKVTGTSVATEHPVCSIKHTPPGDLLGISPALTRSYFAKIFFFPSAYLLSVCNPQGSLHSSHTLQMTASKLSRTHSFPWNSTAITLNCLSILSPRLHLFMNGDIHLPRRSFKFHLLIQQLNPISQSPADSTCLMPFKSIHFWWCLLSPVCFRFLSLLT